MHDSAGKRPGTQDVQQSSPRIGAAAPGKQTLVEQAYEGSVQRLATNGQAHDPSAVQAAAAQGVASAATALPHQEVIQRSFGRHDISGIQAHTGAAATASAGAMGAQAYATGNHVVLGRGTDLHTVAHEAAHVVQQRAGVHLAGGVGRAGDPYEQHADAVADLVVQGKSAEALLDAHAPAGGGAAPTTGAVQHKLEYAAHHAIAPAAAKDAVKADQAAYAQEAEHFELKLGAGLHQRPEAHQGADAMLTRMQQAMTRAGIDDAGQDAAFGSQASANADLGAVLVGDVRAALAGGNLREKMGMVYQARFKIAEALDTLRQQPEDHDLIGDELKSAAMGQAIEAEKRKPRGNVSYAILARRNSVTRQPRAGNRAPVAELTDAQLETDGIPLTEREKRAAEADDSGQRAFVPGRQVYVIPPDVRKREQEDLRRVAAGLSGSADMYFHIAKHLKMPEGERRQLRLASLGQMLANRDHSYHEIMHEAMTQGGLDDYSDDLPIGYTQLAPLSHDEILATAGGATDFPGDAQIRAISAPMKPADDIAREAPDRKLNNRDPAVLEVLRAYENNPSRTQLQVVHDSVDKWLRAKPLVFGKDKYNARAALLREVLKKAKHLLAMHSGLPALGDPLRAQPAHAALTLAPDNDTKRFMDSLADLDGDHADWYAPEFRASTADMALDTSNVEIGPDEDNLGISARVHDNLRETTKGAVGQARWELEGINGTLAPGDTYVTPGDGRDVPDLLPAKDMMSRRHKRSVQQAAYDDARYQREQDDFRNFDATDLQALAPDAPLGGALKRFEGKAVPAELEALNAYTQAGFYEMMNFVLNKRARMNRSSPPSQADQTWWANVPDQTKKLISLAISGVRKMKPYTGPLYRGENLVHGISAQLGKSKAARQTHWNSLLNGTKTYNQFVSTSKRPHSSYIVDKGKYTASHFVNSKSAVDISALGGKLYEREVVFAPGTRFRVTQVEDRFNTNQQGEGPDDRYGSRADEAPPNTNDEMGRIRVTFEEV